MSRVLGPGHAMDRDDYACSVPPNQSDRLLRRLLEDTDEGDVVADAAEQRPQERPDRARAHDEQAFPSSVVARRRAFRRRARGSLIRRSDVLGHPGATNASLGRPTDCGASLSRGPGFVLADSAGVAAAATDGRPAGRTCVPRAAKVPQPGREPDSLR